MAAEGKVVVYTATITHDKNISAQQNRILHILKTQKIGFEERDIASKDEYKDDMKRIIGTNAVAPQICNGEQYCGNYEAFIMANEDGRPVLLEFLKLPADYQLTES